jgi:hypothetical protein
MQSNPQRMSLLSRQWQSYAQYHQSRSNVLLHIVAVPVFMIANALLVVALVRGAWVASVAALAMMAGSTIAQGRGHRLEINRPEPFTGALNVVGRILAEQWLTFPRFVLSGGWSRVLRQPARSAAPTAPCAPTSSRPHHE